MYEERTAAPARLYVLRWPDGKPSLPWRDLDGRPVAPSACPLYLGRVAEASDVGAAIPAYRKDGVTLQAWLGREPDRALLDALAAHEDGDAWWTHDEHRPRGGA